jgi:hypothetical protein
MKNILLINPWYANETWLTDGDDPASPSVHDLVPLGLATVAALTPEGWHVDIWDEPVKGPITADTRFDKQYDIVGVTSWTVNLYRCIELGAFWRARNIPVCIGGPGVSGRPDPWRKHFDVLFVGEVEETWPQFLRDFEAGDYKSEYRQIQKPDIRRSPAPRWDSIADDMRAGKYVFGAVQTTRGCPFDCEFCDVIYLFGRRQRHKAIEQTLQEVRNLEKLGVRRIFFSDDEFVGDPQFTKEFLRALIPVNNSFEVPINFSTQLTLNLGKDEELLRLAAEAGLSSAIIGIETPNVASLKETGKFHNLRKDMVAEVHKILGYGLEIIAGIIVGFDNDGPDIFDIQYDFIQRAYIPSISLNMLKAAIGTRLWARLRQDGRVLDISPTLGKGHSRATTNIMPKRMTREQLFKGFRDLFERLHTWESFEHRMIGWCSVCHTAPRIGAKLATPDDILKAADYLEIGGDGRKAIVNVVDYAAANAPHMLSLMRRMVIKHHKIRRLVDEIVRDTDRMIELERTGALAFDCDNRPIPVTPAFRASFKDLFQPVYTRVYVNLENKDKLPEALTEIFVDFLCHLDGDFQKLEEFHHAYLREVSDRTCAKFNGTPPQDFQPREPDGIAVPDYRKIRLHDDILKNVGQELFTLMVQREQARQAVTK